MDEIIYVYGVIPIIWKLITCVKGRNFRSGFSITLCAFHSSDAPSYLDRRIALIGPSVELLYKSVSKFALTVVVRYWIRNNTSY